MKPDFSANQLLAHIGDLCVREWLMHCIKLRKVGKNHGYYLVESNGRHKGMAGLATGPDLLYLLDISEERFNEYAPCEYVANGPPIESARP
jgi:hypothetical protein